MKIYMLILLLGVIATFAHMSTVSGQAVKHEPLG